MTNTAVTVGQQSDDICPDLFCLTSSREIELNNNQNQREELTPVEIMDVKDQLIAEIVASPFPNCTPIVLPAVLQLAITKQMKSTKICSTFSFQMMVGLATMHVV